MPERSTRERIADDLLIGGPAIAAELGQLAKTITKWLREGRIRGTKIGALWTCSRRNLRRQLLGEGAGDAAD